MVSGTVEALLERIYADTVVRPSEVIELRRAADAAGDDVLALEGHEGVLEALLKSFDVTNQLVQEVALRMRGDDYTDTARAMVMALIDAHIALNRATVDAFAVRPPSVGGD